MYCKFQQDVSLHKVYDNANNQAQRNRVASGNNNIVVCICLQKKNLQFDRVEQTMPDAMHTIAVQVKHLHWCLAGKAPENSLAVDKQKSP